MFERLALLFGLLAIGLIAPLRSEADINARVHLPNQAHHVQVLFAAKPHADWVEVYAKWRASHSYYSAFAIGDGGAFGWATYRHSTRAAKRDALAFCNSYGAGCRVLAIIEPQGHAPAGAMTLSRYAVEEYRRYSEYTQSKAFVVSDGGEYGWSARHNGGDAAYAAAIEYCEQMLSSRPDFLPPVDCHAIEIDP